MDIGTIEQEAGAHSSEECEILELRSLLDTLIANRLMQLCKQYCYGSRVQFRCTLDDNWGASDKVAPLCEWGNASYVWFVDELLKEQRREKIQDSSLISIKKYYNKVIHSVIFLEQYKNWRFRRRIRVPEYIKSIDADAHRIFWYLVDKDNVSNIAQRLNRDRREVARIVDSIVRILHQRGRSHLLELQNIVPLSSLGMEADDAPDSRWLDSTIDELADRSKIYAAYKRLTWLEQFVIDAMVIDRLSAKSVLTSLVQQKVTVDARIKPEDLNSQHIYYFLRKSLGKLRRLADMAGVRNAAKTGEPQV